MRPTALSFAARAFRARLASLLPLDERDVLIGHPAAAARTAEGQSTRQFVNLFFFQIEHAGHPADATDRDPIYVRLLCLVTAFGNDESSGASAVSAGENDLRLLGGVIAALHGAPNLIVEGETSEAVAQLQIVPAAFTLEHINNLFATQVETSYRPSLVYELALAPVPFIARVERSPRVVETGLDVVPIPADGGDAAPQIRFVDGTSLNEVLHVTEDAYPEQVDVAIAGEVGATVTLRWELWDRAGGWRPAPSSTSVQLAIESATLAGATARPIATPDAPEAPAQALLFASLVRTRQPDHPVEIRSNPLLLSVLPGAVP